MTKTSLVALVTLGALTAPISVAHAGWTGWKWKTSHFIGSPLTEGQDAANIMRVPSASVPLKHTLVVFLPGTGESNEVFTDFLSAAANHGYYAIGLDYRHGMHVPNLVGCWPFAAGELYEQNVRGVDNGFFPWAEDFSIPAVNSINFRLGQLLHALDAEQPAGTHVDWLQFWNASTSKPAWSKIVIAGHSQGGSTAGWILKNEGAKAGLIFEGMFDRLSIAASEIRDDLSPLPTEPDNCFGFEGDTAPGWITPGAWVQRMFLIDDKFSPVYTGSPGKHIAATAIDLGKTHEQFIGSVPGTINHSWYTLTAAAGSCGAHGTPIVNDCQPAWVQDLWGALLDRVPTLTSDVPWQ